MNDEPKIMNNSMTPRTDEFVGGLRYALELAHDLEFALTAVTRERDELREELKTMREYHQAAVDNRNAIINQRDELLNQRNQLVRDKNELNAIILNYDLPGLPFRKNNE